MNNNHPVLKLKAYLNDLKSLVSVVDLDSQVYKEGTTAGQIAFHASQAANFWLRVRIMGLSFDRDKDSELAKSHSLEEINNSIDSAIKACGELEEKDLKIEEKLSEPVPMNNGKFIVDTIGSGLIFITSHTAEHVAELTMIRDYVSTLR